MSMNFRYILLAFLSVIVTGCVSPGSTVPVAPVHLATPHAVDPEIKSKERTVTFGVEFVSDNRFKLTTNAFGEQTYSDNHVVFAEPEEGNEIVYSTMTAKYTLSVNVLENIEFHAETQPGGGRFGALVQIGDPENLTQGVFVNVGKYTADNAFLSAGESSNNTFIELGYMMSVQWSEGKRMYGGPVISAQKLRGTLRNASGSPTRYTNFDEVSYGVGVAVTEEWVFFDHFILTANAHFGYVQSLGEWLDNGNIGLGAEYRF